MQPIGSILHGVLDYSIVLALLISPRLIGLPELSSNVAYTFGAALLALTLATNFKMGALRLIPLFIHGWIELSIFSVLAGVSFYLYEIDGEPARNFLLIISFLMLTNWLLTDYRSG